MSQDTPKQLKPCPFCGENPMIDDIEPHEHLIVFDGEKMPDHLGSTVIECGCGAGLIDDTRLKVIERWNTRVSTPKPHEIRDSEGKQRSLTDWQPIETAPKDGTSLLIAGRFGWRGDWNVKIGHWRENYGFMYGLSFVPSHWMPLPPPPDVINAPETPPI